MKRKNKNIWDGKELIWAGDGKTFLRGVGENFLTHPFFEEAYSKILSIYEPKIHYKICLFLPCSYGKPYSQSYIHYMIIKSLRNLKKDYEKIHQIILTNAGIVPKELEEHYPFCCYDWNPKFENPEIKDRYAEVLFNRLKGYILKFNDHYDKFACYLRWNSDAYRAIKRVEFDLDLKIPNFSLNPISINKSEIDEVSYGIYDYEDDLILITSKNLKNLIQRVKETIICGLKVE
ncbi:MAG: DUF5591 domain-containing protein [archaeon]|nr:DUF5591 domain-containing protein [archaeon]MCP8320383.1 DUF5591 domain-containing protein [archaeon]